MADLEQWQVDLDEKGYAIVHNVLDENECEMLENGFWNFWHRLSGGRLKREQPKTWKTIFDFAPLHGMLCQHFSIGHIQEIWNLRSHERVKGIFARLWGTDDLVVSFDGAATGLAPEVTGTGWHHQDWLHMDQAPSLNELECVQAWVTAGDVGPGDATLTCLEGSHKLQGKFAEAFGLENYDSDWLKLKAEHLKWYKQQGSAQITVECPRGSMVLWDSRTVHAGRGPVPKRPARRNRFVAYVCMLPASHLKPGEREIKMRACLEGRHTTHWPAGRVTLFQKLPRNYGDHRILEVPDYEPPHFTLEQARLAGWENPEECPLTIENREDRRKAMEIALEQMDRSRPQKELDHVPRNKGRKRGYQKP